jgi:glycyl-tRNA synthetase
MLTMQAALQRLVDYWGEHDCLILLPMNTEVGAGTLNPATALRVLGPEPWRVAYPEPSVRPDDSRYGDNPNRLQTHTQFQVILKPEPGDPQELFLGSLQALGVDIARHDIRFVEDNWAAPAVGAWGLGWEVWLDGLEITQFTYFQQFGLTLDPVSVEITYGMERIIMALQGVSHFKDIQYAPGVTYGEVLGQIEYEMSRYYLDEADVAANQTLFEAYAREAERLIELRLPVPAHIYVLKCSHTFNVLDARGAISTTERAQAFARMRKLSAEVGRLWVSRREELGFPLGLATAVKIEEPEVSFPVITKPERLVLEVGVEELPPGEVTRAAHAVKVALAEKLSGTRLRYGEITAYSSPRRISVLADAVAPREDDLVETVRGPRRSVAFDADGQPTKAAEGFARSHNITVADLEVLEGSDAYVGFTRNVSGRLATEALAQVLREVVYELRAEKNMRWNAPGLSYSRPIRWLIALLGENIVPFTVSNMVTGRTTRVHRTASPRQIDVPSADSYLECLRTNSIEPDATRRRERIVVGATGLASTVSGYIDIDGDRQVLDEVTNLIEEPTLLLGAFNQDYLELPNAVLATVMKKHQRYLPVRKDSSHLLPHFVAVANGDCDIDLVRSGNEAVLRARFEDARFFWQNDIKTPLATMKERLGRLLFHAKLGSMADRAGRIALIAQELAEQIGLTAQQEEVLHRAGQLAKFDLGSEVVTELPSLAGVMAREYALQAGEPEAVADALYQIELPGSAARSGYPDIPGALLALADRFDLLAGLFAVHTTPTGSSDPFGLRRAALGVVNLLRTLPELQPITLTVGLQIAGEQQPVSLTVEALDTAVAFVARRFEQLMLEAGHRVEDVRAVTPLITIPGRAERTLNQLARLRSSSEFADLTMAFQRVRRIVPIGTSTEYNEDIFEFPAETGLAYALEEMKRRLTDERDLDQVVRQSKVLVSPINKFFDDVLVMTDDQTVRANRLGLLASVYDAVSKGLAWDQLA